MHSFSTPLFFVLNFSNKHHKFEKQSPLIDNMFTRTGLVCFFQTHTYYDTLLSKTPQLEVVYMTYFDASRYNRAR